MFLSHLDCVCRNYLFLLQINIRMLILHSGIIEINNISKPCIVRFNY